MLPLLLAPSAIVVAGALLLLRLYFQPPTVPHYTLVGAQPAGSETELVPGTRFAMELRPTEPVVGAIGARAFLLRGNQVRPWDPPFEVERDGTVRLAGPVDTLFANVPPGAWDVAVAVGRPETLPTAPRDVLRARDATHDADAAAWRLVRRKIYLGPL